LYILYRSFLNWMLDRSRLEAIADLIRERISISGVDEYCSETDICKDDFVRIEPRDFEGEIYAIDGSNVVICDWSVASLNHIRAGYAVYKGRNWQRTVVTYDDLFLADKDNYIDQFEKYTKAFGLNKFTLEKTELDRLSSYFRELQEYIALNDAVNESSTGDLILFDGGFDVFEPLRSVLTKVLMAAKDKGVDLLAISKSSSLSWGGDLSKPFVPHTSYVGSILAPGVPWYLCLKGKKIKPKPESWDGGRIFIARFHAGSDHAFRLDAPSYLMDRIAIALGNLSSHSCSAECLGYPHALFRAHRDLRIKDQEGQFLKLKLLDILGSRGMNEGELRRPLLDYHDVIEMRPRRIL
jgi:hypothetical protein